MYNILAEIMDIGLTMCWACCLCYFYGEFLHLKCAASGKEDAGTAFRGKKTGIFWKNSWPLWCFWIAERLLLNRLILSEYSSFKMLGKFLLLYGSLFLFTCLCYKGKRSTVLFLSVTFAAVSEIGRFLAYTVSLLGNWLFDLDYRLWERGKIMDLELYVALLEIQSCVIQLIMNVFFGVCLWKALSYIRESFRECGPDFDRAELTFLLLPGCTGLALCVLLRIIMVTMEGELPRFLYDKYPLLIGVVPVLLLLCLFSILYSVKLFRQLRYLHEEKNRNAVLGQQLESMEEHLRETERVYAGVRAMKHDMKNQLAVLAELAERPETKTELQTYLAQVNQTLSRLDFPCRTGSAAVDTLLGIKYHEMRERIPGIVFETEGLVIPESLRVRHMDLSLILGNGLDNAIEACERLSHAGESGKDGSFPWIRVSAMMKASFFLLLIENSFDGRLKFDGERDFPVTRKEDGSLHGIGLRSIETVAIKYHGGADWSAEGKVFTLTVLLKNE